MPTATHSQTSKSKSTRSKSASSRTKSTARKSTAQKDAIQLLKADHRAVEKLFRDFEKASGEERKQRLAMQICNELKVHTQIEEEIFYPMSRDNLDDEDLINEAIVEHQAAKDLIEQIEGMDPSDEMFDAKVKVLQEQIEHHVGEEEKEMFPKVQKSDMDLKGVGERLKTRKEELMGQMDASGRGIQ
jgi:hemerythrin superfamily protein